MKHILLLITGFLLFSCSPEKAHTTISLDEKKTNGQNLEQSFLTKNNAAHAKGLFLEKKVISAEIELFFGGKLRLDATLLYHTRTGKTKIVYKDSSELTFNGKHVYLSPASLEKPSARFDIFTWSYFLALPYKIVDKGTHLSDFENKDLNGKEFNVEKLTFGENVGDSPDDWYILYQDKATHLLHAAAYIVTLNKTVEEGEKDPHAIVYSDYQEVDGISVAHRWDFFGWTKAEGLTDSLGYANLKNIRFLEDNSVSFEPIEGSKIVE